MKRAFLLFALVAGFASCKKEVPFAYNIRYVVEGNGIEEIKYTCGNIVRKAGSNASGGWDTTFSHNMRQKLQIQAKARSGASGVLSGIIYLNDKEVGKIVDEGPDANGYYEIKVEHSI